MGDSEVRAPRMSLRSCGLWDLHYARERADGSASCSAKASDMRALKDEDEAA